MLRADAGTLAAALAKVLPLVEYRNTIPILSMARLRVEAGTLTVSATNLDQQIDAEALVEAPASAQITTDPRRLHAILRLLGKREPVELIDEGHRVVVAWNGARLALPALPASDFPDLVLDEGNRLSATLDAEALAGLQRVAPFISTQETRYFLTGACLWPTKEGLCWVATDGSQMCVMSAGAGLSAIASGLTGKPIIPHDAVRHWLRLASIADAESFTLSGNIKMELRGDGYVLRSKLIDGSFPPWERAVPNRQDLKPVRLSRLAMLRAISIVIASMPPKSETGMLVVANGRTELQSHTYDGEVAIDLGPAQAPPIEVGVNPHRLNRAVRATRGDQITIWSEEGSATGPMLVEGSDGGPNERVVLMPLRSATRASFSAPPMAEAA